jgi:coenzyme F420-reducing hydrogenase gamma subunit
VPESATAEDILHQTVSQKFTVEKSKIVCPFGKCAGNAYVWNFSSRWEGGPHCERR